MTRSTVSTRSISRVTVRISSRPSGAEDGVAFERDDQRARAAKLLPEALVLDVDRVLASRTTRSCRCRAVGEIGAGRRHDGAPSTTMPVEPPAPAEDPWGQTSADSDHRASCSSVRRLKSASLRPTSYSALVTDISVRVRSRRSRIASSRAVQMPLICSSFRTSKVFATSSRRLKLSACDDHERVLQHGGDHARISRSGVLCARLEPPGRPRLALSDRSTRRRHRR